MNESGLSGSEKPRGADGLSIGRGLRIAIVLSALWMFAVLLVILSSSYDFEQEELAMFGTFGILPVGLLWGIVWIVRAPGRRG